MKLVYLKGNLAWVFMLGDAFVRLGREEMFYEQRQEACDTALEYGLIVLDDNSVEAIS